jgi:hypothetical protein
MDIDEFFIYQHLEDIWDDKMDEQLAPGTRTPGAIEAHRL